MTRLAGTGACGVEIRSPARIEQFLAQCGLTLPSSGPAFGSPLKSNVRPRKETDHASVAALRCLARAFAQDTNRRRRFGRAASCQGLTQSGLRLSALRQPAHGHIRSRASRLGALIQAPLALDRSTKIQFAYLLQGRESGATLCAPIFRLSPGVEPAACASSVGMLRHPHEYTSARQGRS